MWSKISNALKPRHAHEDEPSSSQADVMSKVLEQHPNMSVFQNSGELSAPKLPPTTPDSPSKLSRRGMFKRISKMPPKDDGESLREESPAIGMPKKVRPSLNMNGNNSQLSLAPSTSVINSRRSLETLGRPAGSFEATSRPSQDITPSPTLRRPSLDMLRSESSRAQQDSFLLKSLPHIVDDAPFTPGSDPRFSSVRSILRDPKTPGTGQNVRFFSRDAYKVISADQSLDADYKPLPQPPAEEQKSFLDRLNKALPVHGSAPAAVTRAASRSTLKSRPSVTAVFSPPKSEEQPLAAHQESDKSNDSMSLTNQSPTPDLSNIFNMSHQLDIPSFQPRLSFDVSASMLDSAMEFDASVNEGSSQGGDSGPTRMTSTPYKPKGNGKAKEIEEKPEGDTNVSTSLLEDKENLPIPMAIDETIFHAKEKSPRLPAPLHDRSQSFSFGQTVFYSMNGNLTSSPKLSSQSSDYSGAYPSSELKGEDLPLRSTSSGSSKGRSRALSDTVFQSMLRNSPKPPEADINDESSSDLVVYSAGSPQPDPFSANANTYYTPQTMIPATPPQGAPKHSRKTSKEENIIFSLQTQLALQTELCGQYETDLRARDELVEILGKKLADVEKEESKRKSALRNWKKKVQELERACRYLEEEVEGSRQDSMERSVMDEASSEALRMLHRQIAGLERERSEWTRKEQIMQEEVQTLEALVKDRSEDVMNLKEVIWSRDESERELKEGIREAKEQIEMMGNISVGLVDLEELKKLAMEKDQSGDTQKLNSRLEETRLEQEKQELLNEIEGMQVVESGLREQLDSLRTQLDAKTAEFAILKGELEAQWGHTEKNSEKLESMEKEKRQIETERDAFKRDVEELEGRIVTMEVEWNESENKRAELEAEVQETWTVKEILEKEKLDLEDQLHLECERSESLTDAHRECETRLSNIDHERQFAIDNVARLEDNLKHRNQELSEYSQRIVQCEAEAEELREHISNIRREHSQVVGAQNRALEDAAGMEDQTQAQLEELVRQKAEADIEIQTTRERVSALKEEVERLRRQVHELQQESADKEVKLVQVTKQRSQDKEDLQGLNIALDAKQQELELLKRRMGVRGTAGSTPAQPSKIAGRRDSAIFSSTPSYTRPSSVISDSGLEPAFGNKESKLSQEGPPKPIALGKSIKLNGSTTSTPITPSVKPSLRSVEGSMGPPPTIPRNSLAGTPTPSARRLSLTRSSSTKPQVVTPIPHRRVSSANIEQGISRKKASRSSVTSPSVSEIDEKENVDLTSRRRSMIPAPA